MRDLVLNAFFDFTIGEGAILVLVQVQELYAQLGHLLLLQVQLIHIRNYCLLERAQSHHFAQFFSNLQVESFVGEFAELVAQAFFDFTLAPFVFIEQSLSAPPRFVIWV